MTKEEIMRDGFAQIMSLREAKNKGLIEEISSGYYKFTEKVKFNTLLVPSMIPYFGKVINTSSLHASNENVIRLGAFTWPIDVIKR